VVIQGDSAGAASVALHLSAFGGRDDHLFVGAISQSPYFISTKQVGESESQFSNVSAALGCSGALDRLACIRSRNTTAIQALNVIPLAQLSSGTAFVPGWAPCIDGYFIQDFPNNLYQQGRFVKVPMITSDDTNEGTGFVTNASTPAQISEFMKVQFPHLSQSQLETINSLYPLEAPLPLHAAYFPSLAQAYGEAVFICPGLEIASDQSHYNSPKKVWNYRYNVQDAAEIALGYGVPHVSENPAIWGVGPTGSSIGVGGSYSSYNAPIIPVIMSYYINFIKYLDPNGIRPNPVLPQWNNLNRGLGQQRLLFELNHTSMRMFLVIS
jgi:carboxylesterase type B